MQASREYTQHSPFDLAKRLVDEGEMNERAAQLMVEMFSGKSSPEMREIIEAIHAELTRIDLATKADLMEALKPYATSLDIENALLKQKIDLLERIGKVESNLRVWIISVGGVVAILANIDRLMSLIL